MGHAPLVEKVQALPCSRPIPCLKWSWFGNVNSVAVTHGSGELCVVMGMVLNRSMTFEVKRPTTKAKGKLKGHCRRRWVVLFLCAAKGESFVGATWQVVR